MSKTLKFTDIAPGILRMRLSEAHGETLAERYGILTLPSELSASGITASEDKITLASGRELPFRIIDEASDEYASLHASLSEEFASKFTDYQAIIGTPEYGEDKPHTELSLEPPEASFAIELDIADGERFYGLGEGANDRIELRGRAYQNWVRYQYNEIPIPLCVSSEGWAIWLNARSRSFFDIGGRTEGKLLALGEDDELDIFILEGDSIAALLERYTLLTGRPMLLPKWAYGLTYIAPIFGTQFDIMTQAERFRKEHIPCDMFSLEPGWMTKFYDYSTKKEWDIRRFHVTEHMMRANYSDITFIKALKRYGFNLSLWLCVRHDLTAEAERSLVNGNPDDYGEAWYEHLKKFTALGVAGYKLDPADIVCCFDRMARPRCFNGLTTMQMHNYNQILLPKQMYEGFSAQENKRPMHHYCGGYSGIQKWSAATTGDNGGELGAMIWLETLALSGHTNTTIDMNIHHPESVHFGFLVPWAHLNAWHGLEQPWYAGDKQHVMFAEYARMRYRILPYLYSAAIEAHETGLPMVRPMPLAFPEDEAVASSTKQYMLGENLLVTAYTNEIHLPAGRWIDAWTGDEFVGPCDITYEAPEKRGGGLFIKGGAIIPGWSDRDYISQKSDECISLDIYPDGDSELIFREDDGISLDCNTKASCRTHITVTETDEKVTVTIGERVGDYDGKPETRRWLVRVHPKPNTDQLLEVKCAEGDKVFFSIPENPVAIFNPNAEDVLKI